MRKMGYVACSVPIEHLLYLLEQNGLTVFLIEYDSETESAQKIPLETDTSAASRASAAGTAGASESSETSEASDVSGVSGVSGVSDLSEASAYMRDDREAELADYLHQLGIPAHIKGYEYLKKAITLAMEDSSILGAITKELYPDVASSCGSTPPRVERAIRHAIETAWNRGDMSLQEDLFGTTISSERGKPTNSEFISMIAEHFRLR